MRSKRYLEVCAGISATSIAAKGTAWTAHAYAEIEPFCCAVLKHHYPDTPNLGSLTEHDTWNIEPGTIDALIGGTPCQAFSVAGERGGIHDDRGNLALQFLQLAGRARPRWVVWENVPGVLSSISHEAPEPVLPRDDMDPAEWERWQGGVVTDEYDADEMHAFQCFITRLQELGYGVAWRTLDAQHFGVAQQRRRVFVVGYLGDWRGAVAALFERECLRGDSAESGEPWPDAAGAPDGSAEGGDIAGTISARYNDNRGRQGGNTDGCITQGHLVPATTAANPADSAPEVPGRRLARTLNAGAQGRQDFDTETMVVSSLTASDGGPDVKQAQAGHLVAPITTSPYADRGADESKLVVGVRLHGTDGTVKAGSITETAAALMAKPPGHITNSTTTAVLAFEPRHRGDDGRGYDRPPAVMEDKSPTLNTVKPPCITEGYAFQPRIARNGRGDMGSTVNSLTAQAGTDGRGDAAPCVATTGAVRRLTVRECERLMGMPDDYTLIRWPGRKRDLADFAETFEYLRAGGWSDADAWELADTPDGPRYKAVGNSIAVPVMHWILQRLDAVDAINETTTP